MDTPSNLPSSQRADKQRIKKEAHRDIVHDSVRWYGCGVDRTSEPGLPDGKLARTAFNAIIKLLTTA
jgi:hypothetical protein